MTGDIRAARGLTARFTYVYGQLLRHLERRPDGQQQHPNGESAELDGERAPDGNRQQFRAFYLYDLPSLHKSSALVRGIAGGWQLSGSTSITSGDFLNVTLGQDYNFDSVAGDRPDLVRPITYTSGTRDQKAVRYFDTTAVRQHPRHEPYSARCHAMHSWDRPRWNASLALLKKFHIREVSSCNFAAKLTTS